MSDTKKYTFDLIKIKPLSGLNSNRMKKDTGVMKDVKRGFKDPIQKKNSGGSIKKQKPKTKNKFKDNPEDRFGKYRIMEASKGTKLKDILGDKKGTVVYKGKNKNYRMTIPVAPKPKKG